MARRPRIVAVNPAEGVYEVTGSLDGVRFGDRVVRTLTLRRLGTEATEGLRPLAPLRDLRRLHLERIAGIDLAPLAELKLEILDIQDVRDVDLAPLTSFAGLWYLQLVSVRDCRMPTRLSLPSSLQILGLAFHDDLREPFADLIETIDWDDLAGLESLSLRGDPGYPARIDLGFLARLNRLTSVKLDCVWHRGATPSPLEPPFEGLPRTLRKVIVDAWESSVAKQVLQQHLPDAEIVVDRRYDPDDGEGAGGEWAILPPESSVREWSTYVWDAMDSSDDETEYDAMKAATAKLRAADPQLLASLDFDHESDGTGITAPTREALERALQILGVQ